MIIRKMYLAKIRPFYEVDLIKVITGIEGCGKSVILKQIIDELKKTGVKESQIIYINFEFEDNNELFEHKGFNAYVEEKIGKNKEVKHYLFFDEVQNVNKWWLAINSFKAKYGEKVSIFITGSDVDLSLRELATHMAGRYVSFKIYPFSFKEVCELKGITSKNKYELKDFFDEYLIWDEMSIWKKEWSVNKERKKQLGAYLENIVYNELLARGYEVNVGMLDKGEVDFIATRFDEKLYFQVCYVLADEDVIDRKFGVFKNIQDNYPKYVISTDTVDMSQDGIIHRNVIDWLLE